MYEIQQGLGRIRDLVTRGFFGSVGREEATHPEPLSIEVEPESQSKLGSKPGSVKILREIQNLGLLITGSYFQEFRIPLLASDLTGTPTLSRLLSEIPTDYLWFRFQKNRFWLPDSYLETPNASLEILIPVENIGEAPEITGLMIRSGRIRQKGVNPPHFYQHHDFFLLTPQEDHPYQGRELVTNRGFRPIDLLEEVKHIIIGLKSEFSQHHQQEADSLLNPAQRSLVRAIRERCISILQGSTQKKRADEYLILGNGNLTGKLDWLMVFASIASERQTGKLWFDERIFDGIPISMRDSDSHSTHFLGFGSRGYQAGEISIEGLYQGDSIILERVPLLLCAERDMPLDGLIGDLFQHFLYRRTNQEYEGGEFKPGQEAEKQDDFLNKILTDFKEAVILESRIFQFS